LELVKAMSMSGISKSQVSRLCTEIDERVNAFLARPIIHSGALSASATERDSRLVHHILGHDLRACR
jgi:hypothetical protein